MNDSKSAKIEASEAKTKLFNRLARIEGQVRGIKKMIESEQDCTKIVTQITAIKQAVNMLATELLSNEMLCRFEQGRPVDKKYLENLLKLK